MSMDAAIAIETLTRFTGEAQVIDYGNYSGWMSTKDLRLKLEELSLKPVGARSIDILFSKSVFVF